ncbi:hypothetical protein ACSBR2_039492 [Camellia fascicularis]
MIEAIHINNLNHNEFRKCDDLISKIIRTYDPRDNAFHIGGASVKFGSSDVRLIFGLQCRKRHLDLSPGQRPVSDFIQRRCRDTARLTSKLVKSETISWAFVRYMNNLNTVRMYDWIGAIMIALMGPVKEFHRMPWKVTGYVVALLYWICEHSTILEPQTDNMFPRFMKWDIGKLLSKAQGVDLSGPINFRYVKVDRLRSFDYEREVMEVDVVVLENVELDVFDCVGGDEAFVDEFKGDGRHTETAMHADNLEFGLAMDVKSAVRGKGTNQT